MSRIIAAAMWVNAYLVNLFHMDSSAGIIYVISNKRNIYK